MAARDAGGQCSSAKSWNQRTDKRTNEANDGVWVVLRGGSGALMPFAAALVDGCERNRRLCMNPRACHKNRESGGYVSISPSSCLRLRMTITRLLAHERPLGLFFRTDAGGNK